MLEWKKINDFNYEISNLGEVRNYTTGKIIKPSILLKRYFRVCLAKNGVNKYFLVHRLVAEYFCDKPIGCNIVHHIDNNGFNNVPDNLMWTTQSYNIKMVYAGEHNQYRLLRVGKKNPNYKHGRYCRSKYLSVKKRKRKNVW